MAGTLVDHPFQAAPHPAQFAQTLFDPQRMRLCALFHAAHAAFAIYRQRQQLANLGQIETQRFRPADKAQSPHIVVAIFAVAGCAPRFRQQTFAFVETDRVDAHGGELGDPTDGVA